jgi:hypothetical protein
MLISGPRPGASLLTASTDYSLSGLREMAQEPRKTVPSTILGAVRPRPLTYYQGYDFGRRPAFDRSRTA